MEIVVNMPDVRLINANALRNSFIDTFWKLMAGKDDTAFDVFDVMRNVIDNAPTVDTYIEDDIHEAIKAGYQDGYGMAKAKFERSQCELVEEIIEELESRKDYGVDYAQAMEDVIVILNAKFGMGKEAKNE